MALLSELQGGKSYLSLPTAAMALLLTSPASVAQIEREYGQHVHGEGNAEVVIENNAVTIDLSLPAVNVVGFEHAPRNEVDEAAIEEALVFFRNEPWIVFSPRAGCEVVSINAHIHGFDGGHAHGHDHNHAHDHDGHDHNGHHHVHADFHVLLTATCEDATALRWIDLDVFSPFPGNELLRVDVLGEELAVRARLVPGQARIDLQ